MARRIYWQTIIKFLKEHKLWSVGTGTLVGALFLYLVLTGGITVTGHSGDMVCAGTELDPCYAVINFTANEDIFLYKTNYDPWGRNSTFDFSPAIKSWKLQRSWGSGWRDINLQEGCTGSWCGCYWCRANNTAEYSYVFRKGRNYTIRIVGYKHSPYDDVKWTAFEGIKGELDPVWLGLNWSFDGNKVYINDSRAYISAEPYLIKKPENVTFELKTKNYDGELNFVYLFDEKTIQPKNFWYYNPYEVSYNTSHSKLIPNVTNYDQSTANCNYGNEYNRTWR